MAATTGNIPNLDPLRVVNTGGTATTVTTSNNQAQVNVRATLMLVLALLVDSRKLTLKKAKELLEKTDKVYMDKDVPGELSDIVIDLRKAGK